MKTQLSDSKKLHNHLFIIVAATLIGLATPFILFWFVVILFGGPVPA